MVWTKEQKQEYAKQWAKDNPDKCIKKVRKWEKNHREQFLIGKRKRQKKYRDSHLKEAHNYGKDYRKKNSEKVRLRLREAHRKQISQIIQLLGGQCANPYGQHKEPYTDIRCLEIDHVHDGGHRERKKYSVWKYYNHILKEVQNGSKEYQCLCANCNRIKRWEFFEQAKHLSTEFLNT
jgi:hypothetical protein